MNICFVALSFPPKGEPTSGVGAQVRVLAEGLIAAGHSVQIATLGSSNATRYESGIEVHEIRGGNLHWYIGKLPLLGRLFLEPVRELEYSIAAWKGVRRAAKNGAVDLIEGAETGMLFLTMRWRQSPVVVRLHGEQYTFHKYTPGMRLTVGVRQARVLQRMALRRAKLLISPSRTHAVEIQHELKSELPIAIVPNSVALDKVQVSSVDNVPEPNIVLYVGRIERRKGISTLLKAASQVGRVVPNVRFVFAGAFHKCFQPAEFHKLAEDLKIAEQITVLGAIGYEQLTSWYQRSALIVLPSHYETFGMAAIEPMAFGKPVVVARGGALPEVVEDGVTGLVVDCGDASALSDAIVSLLSDGVKREAMGVAARERACSQFSMEHNLQANLDLYCRARAESDRGFDRRELSEVRAR
jgi:glycosyltransferase involved in cell wall biosynthesis